MTGWTIRRAADPQLSFYRLPGSRVDYDANSDNRDVQAVANHPVEG